MQPKKSLGQNFLKDLNVLEKIIEAANLTSGDLIIEIGPGQGVLTQELIKHARKIIAIEKDDNLSRALKNRFKNNNLEIINADILEINLPKLIEENHFENYKVVANIPYYITSPIIQLFLETKYPPREMILMVQKEVAERIVAKPGKMSILAISVQYYAWAELLFHVDKNSFWPVPEVDSAVIKISPKKLAADDTKHFFQIVHAGFAAKRKTLLNNLANSLHLPREVAEAKIKKAGIDPGLRAQELAVDDWKRLAENFR